MVADLGRPWVPCIVPTPSRVSPLRRVMLLVMVGGVSQILLNLDAYCQLPRVRPLMRDIEDVLLLYRLIAFFDVSEYGLAVMLLVLVYGSDGLVVKEQFSDIAIRRPVVTSILSSLLDQPRRETLVDHIECDLGSFVKQPNLFDGLK